MKTRVLTSLVAAALAFHVVTTVLAQQPELVVQTGHTNNVNSVAFSPDGKILASGGWDNTIILWEVATGRQLRQLIGHVGWINSLAFTPDGKTLVSAGDDQTIRLWDMATAREMKVIANPIGSVYSIAVSPDGQTLAAGSSSATITLWDIATYRSLREFGKHSHLVSSLAFSSDGKILASGSFDKTVKLWDVAAGTEIRTLTGHSDYVSSVAFTSNGQALASGSYDKTIKLWEVATGRELRALTGHSDWVVSLAITADDKMLVSGGNDNLVKLWDMTTGNELRSLTGHNATVRAVTFGRDGKTVASGGGDKTIKLWETGTGRAVRDFTARSSAVSSVAFSPDGKFLATGSHGRTIHLWEMLTGTQVRAFDAHDSGITFVEFSRDSKTLASSSFIGSIKLWDVESGRELQVLKGHSDVVKSTAFSATGLRLASGGADKTVKLWDVAKGSEIKTFRGHSESVESIAFSPDGKTLASGSNDRTIKLWDVDTGRESRTLSNHTAQVSMVAFSPDGKTLVSSSVDSTIKLWDVTSGAELRELKGHTSTVFSVAFSPNGQTLATGGYDHLIKLWDVATGRELRTLKGHTNWVRSLSFSADGKVLISGGVSNALLWRVDTGELLASPISLDRGDWAVVTPSGLFDASPGARKLMHYIIGTEVVTLDQMKDLYYVPGLLQKSIAGDALPKVQLFGAQDLFPDAEYKPLKPGEQTLTVKLRNRGGGIGPAQVLVNGTEVTADARPAGFDPQTKEATLTIDLAGVKQLVPGKENKVEVIARNAAGSLSSKSSARGATITVIGAGAARAEPPHLYAIVGGVSNYIGDSLRLQYSGKDAKDFARALEIGAAKFLGRDKVHIRLLTSESVGIDQPLSGQDSTVGLPSKENFRQAFSEFATKAKPNDLLIVYLSGHGVALKLNQDSTKPGGDTYLYLTSEAYTTEPAALADTKVRSATSVSGEELVRWIREIAALSKALVLDTCAAGVAAETLIARKADPGDSIRIRALDRLRDSTGFFILMGSAGDRVSYEATPYRQGLLTYTLLEALKGAKLHDGGYANVGQLFDYAQERVPLIAQTLGLSQQPRFLAPDIGSPFDIGLYTADEQKLFTLPSRSPLILRPSLQNRDLGYDNLRLLPGFQRALLAMNYVKTRGTEEPLMVFVDTSEMRDGIMPVGLYTVAGDKVTINLNLIRNDERISTITVEGVVADEPGKAALVKRLIAAISAEAHKFVN